MDGASQNPHGQTSEEILRALEVSAAEGLSPAEVRRRRRRFGRNRLRQLKERSAWRILADQFESVIVWLLAGAAALSFWLGEWAEGVAILAVLAINAAIGFTTELKATRSMESLRRFSRMLTKVRRRGRMVEVPAQDLVPGDVALLEAGDVVTADLRLVESANLQCDESALTGESVPVAKGPPPVADDTPLAERSCMAFKGTAVTRGSAAGVVVATGMATELGQISALAEEAEGETSPLEKRLDRLGAQLVWATLALAGAIGAAGVYVGKDPVSMVKTAIALAVAAVPEGLPIVATVVLARGMWRMARRNALIQRLSAVETLGATTIILTDKTGTLTENRMTVTRLLLAAGLVEVGDGSGETTFTIGDKPLDEKEKTLLDRALRTAVLCNNAALSEDQGAGRGVGDPMEVALLAVGAKNGIKRGALIERSPEAREEAFTSETNMMATFHPTDGGCLVAVKGAPEPVLAHAERVMTADGPAPLNQAGREAWTRHNDELARRGLRTLALATKDAASKDESPYTSLTLLGLIGLLDPPRADVAGAIEACRGAGLRVVMVTGDHIETAKRIAAEVGLANGTLTAIEARDLGDLERLSADDRARLLNATVFARISPKTKLDLVALFQASGAVVAMTGDGVNDAPALKKADIGIAMGQRGTQVAREAADMVLRDDAFTSIVAAMAQGRIVFGNIRKFVTYLMSCNFSEIITIGLATVSGLPLPLLPLQILFLNLVTDVFPAFALGAGEGEAGTMRRPPRDPKEPIVDARTWAEIGAYGLLITAATLGAFVAALFWLDLGEAAAVTVSFLTLAFAQVLHVFNMRAPGSAWARNEVTRNPFVWGAVILCTGLILAAVYLPGLSSVLGLVPLGSEGWTLVAAASLAPLIVGQLAKAASSARSRPAAPPRLA